MANNRNSIYTILCTQDEKSEENLRKLAPQRLACLLYKWEDDNKVYLSVYVPRRGSASPAEATIGGHPLAAAFPKPRLVKAAVISERPGACPPSRRVAGACASGRSSSISSRLKHGGPEREAGTMFRRKLTALDYHNPAGFNCKGETVVPGRPGARDPAGRRAPYPHPPRPCLPRGHRAVLFSWPPSTSGFRRLSSSPPSTPARSGCRSPLPRSYFSTLSVRTC